MDVDEDESKDNTDQTAAEDEIEDTTENDTVARKALSCVAAETPHPGTEILTGFSLNETGYLVVRAFYLGLGHSPRFARDGQGGASQRRYVTLRRGFGRLVG
jgi:hypothetical protein